MDRLRNPPYAALMTNTHPTTRTAQTTLVIGASGKTGRRVADRLTAAGCPVRGASRSAETRLDWEHEATWAPALAGIEAVYITYYPDLAFPGAADRPRRR